jgi:hypothetical protein
MIHAAADRRTHRGPGADGGHVIVAGDRHHRATDMLASLVIDVAFLGTNGISLE